MSEPARSPRGFAGYWDDPALSSYGGEVQVYESSAALGPHIWLSATAPCDLNDREGPTVRASLHLPLSEATKLRDQLTRLIDGHYMRDA